MIPRSDSTAQYEAFNRKDLVAKWKLDKTFSWHTHYGVTVQERREPVVWIFVGAKGGVSVQKCL